MQSDWNRVSLMLTAKHLHFSPDRMLSGFNTFCFVVKSNHTRRMIQSLASRVNDRNTLALFSPTCHLLVKLSLAPLTIRTFAFSVPCSVLLFPKRPHYPLLYCCFYLTECCSMHYSIFASVFSWCLVSNELWTENYTQRRFGIKDVTRCHHLVTQPGPEEVSAVSASRLHYIFILWSGSRIYSYLIIIF